MSASASRRAARQRKIARTGPQRYVSLSQRFPFKRFRLTPVAVALGAAMGLPMASHSQQIVIDGRTATSLATSGKVTNVTTATMVGNNAFNAFSKFDVYAGNTVNLVVPSGANNLLNLVNSASASRIDGTLNAVKNGRIGGNVYLANPEGIIVGASGVINVGSLSLLTPSHAFVDSFFDAAGLPNANSVTGMLNGTVPINPNGLIRVKGRINAIGDAVLRAGNINVDGVIQSGAVFTNTQVDFSDVVNTTDIRTGSAVIVSNGKIQIVAENDVAIAGTVATNGGNNVNAGSIEIRAGHDLELSDGTFLSASGRGGHSSGGTIFAWADNNTALRHGALLRADGGDISGDGGAIEVSAKKRLTLGGGALSAMATQGVDGSILFDPEDIEIQWDLLRGEPMALPQGVSWNAGSLALEATNTITLDSGVVLSTRQVTVGSSQTAREAHISNASTGDSGDVTITARSIVLEDGSMILAHASAGHKAGDISITATDNADDPFFGSLEDQSAGIAIHGATLKGGKISLTATANDAYDWGVDSKIGTYLLKQLENAAYTIDASLSEAKASVLLDQGTSIVASGDVEISSKASSEASMRVLSPNGFAAGYGRSTASATTDILDASITSGGNVMISADGSAATDVIVNAQNVGRTNSLALNASKYVDLAVAISEAQLDSRAVVGGAATINATQAVTVSATGKKTANANATGGAYDDGTAGAGVAFSSYTANITAAIDGKVQDAASVSVKADLSSAGANNSIAANSGSGTGNFGGKIRNLSVNAQLSDAVSFLQSSLMSAVGSNSNSPVTGKSLGLAASFLSLDQDNNVEARIGAGAQVKSRGVVTVDAYAEDILTYRAAASVDQAVYGSGSSQSKAAKDVALSAAVAIVDLENHTKAYIDDNAVVDAPGTIAVAAHSDVPAPLALWGDWSGVSDFESGAVRVFDLLTSNTFSVITGWTQAGVESRKLGVSGSFNVFDLENTADAWIGERAKINVGQSYADTGDVTVTATASQGTLNLAGVFGFKFFPGPNQGPGIGGALASMNFVDRASATIGAGAMVQARNLTVEANTESNNLTIAEAGGKSTSSVAFDASVALVDVNNTTHALIDSSATILAFGDLTVKAEDTSRTITIAGGFSVGSNAVGVGIAIDDIKRETRAAFDQTTAVLPSSISLGMPVANTITLPPGVTLLPGQALVYHAGSGGAISGLADGAVYYVVIPDAAHPDKIQLAGSAQDAASGQVLALGTPAGSGHTLGKTAVVSAGGAVTLDARTRGFLSSTAVAAAYVEDQKSPDADPPADLTKSPETKQDYDARQQRIADHGAKMQARWGVGISGGASIATVHETTEASMTGIRVDEAASLQVSATNSSDTYTAAGAFAISKSKGSVPGIAGSYARNITDNSTKAFVTGSTVESSGAVNVLADTSDSSMYSVSVGLGFSSNSSGIAGAVSVNTIDDEILASIEGSSAVHGASVSLQANDGASIFALAGTISVAGKQGTGFGGSLAINEISNHSTARILDSDVEARNGGILIAQRADQDIESIAVSAGTSQKGLALNFGVSINEIGSTDEAYAKGKLAAGLVASGNIEVSAADESSIDTYAAGLALSTQSSAGGGAGVYSAIDNDVSAYLDGAKAQSSAGNLVVKATTDDEIFSFVAGAAGGQSTGVAGSVSVNRIDTDTKAWINASDVDVDGSVAVTADANYEFDVWGGALGVGLNSVGFGGSVGVNLLYGDTSAWIGGASLVDADGDSAAQTLTRDAGGTRDAYGVAVAARTTQHVENWLVSGGFGGGFGIALTGSGSEATSQTAAYINGGSQINSRNAADANALQSVGVEAFSDTRYVSRLGSLAGSGGTAIGATAAVGLMGTGTRAYIDTAQVRANDDILVKANSKESLEAAGATASIGGDVGLAGTVFVSLFDATTEAYIRNANPIKAGGDLTVEATDFVEIGRNETSGLLGGSLAGAGAVAVSGVVSNVSIANTTRAYLRDVKSDAGGETKVDASSSQDLHSGLLGIAIAGGAAMSASVIVTDIATSTEAFIEQTTPGATVVNGDAAAASSVQDVKVTANSMTAVDSRIVGANVAAAAGGASVDVTSIRNDDSAVIGAGVDANAKRDVSVSATSGHEVDSEVVAFGGGAGVAQGAVSIVNIGSSVTGDSATQSADASQTSSGQSADAKAMMGFSGEGTYASGGAFDKSSTPGGTTALIGTGASIEAGGGISVAATNTIEMDVLTGTATASVGAIGGAVGIANLDPEVRAHVGDNAKLKAGTDISVMANAVIVGVDVDAYAGGVGAAVISAAVALIDSNAQVKASLGTGVQVTSARSITVEAQRSSEQSAEAWGLSLGAAGAIGASVAESSSGGTTEAYVDNNADLALAGSLAIKAKVNPEGTAFGNSAYAVAGAGGGLVGASGAEARAISTGDVFATTGTEVKLPTGDVILGATRQSAQSAETMGMTGGGYLAIGVTISKAESSGLTHAELGADASTANDRKGALSISALATDSNEADSTAGSGGAVAGNGAEASTADNSSVYAGIAANAGAAELLHAGAVTLQAAHSSIYSGQANSVNAALLGASGSFVNNDLKANAKAVIGAGVGIDATDLIGVGARNEFYSAVGGDSATGAAGGVISGSAAVSSTSIESTTSAALGTGVNLASGTDPLSQPGGILLDASTIVLASDRVQLTTGGAIAGAGTDSSIGATIRNNALIGAGATLESQGNISAGTYTLAGLQSESRVSTWGLAGVGVAKSSTSADIDEKVAVGAGSSITAFGNVNLTAGDDPRGIYDSSVTASADALSYVRGLIAVPLSYADASITSDALLDIGQGAQINSAQNVTIGAYNGLINPVTNGEGHGFQLGFIPTENGNQGGGPSKALTASLINNGDVTAGYYYRLNITIPDCPTALNCQVLADPGGAPFDWSYNKAFNAPAFIDANFGGAGGALLASGTSSTPVGAIALGTLFASGGNVTVNADTISGSGSITAHGAPEITVTNNSKNYLLLGNVLIPNTPGGRVQFTGGAELADASGMTIHQEPNQEGTITIHNTARGPIGDSAYGPALFLMGDIENIGGKVIITNDYGSLGQSATIFGKEVHVTVPEGVAVIDIPDGVYYAGGNPYTEWQDFWAWPDDTPGNVVPDATTLFQTIFTPTWEQAPRQGEHRYFSYADCSGFDCYMNRIDPVETYAYVTNDNNQANLEGSRRSSAIYGGKVQITAKYIDINGGITIGADTDWSLNLASSLMDPVTATFLGIPLNGGEIARADYLYARGLVANPIFELTTVTADSGDSRVGVKYDAQNKRLLLDNVKASSDGGSLVLDGKIISTNGLGSIHVNGGLGDVDIENQTGLQVVVQDVYAGNPGTRQSVVSTVDITDRNYASASNHWIYQYTPQDGLNVYRGAEGSTLASGMGAIATNGSSSQLYQPLPGLRWVWEQVATMQVSPTIIPAGSTNTSLENWSNRLGTGATWSWDMPTGQPNNPWQYVTWDDNGNRTGQLDLTPTGKLTQGNVGDPVFARTFRAEVTDSWGFWADDGGSQNFHFDNRFTHTLFYAEKVTMTMTSSLKADNPIAIDFSGSSVGRVAINSIGNVSLTGTITNPGGPTTINAVGSVTQSAGASIQTDSLVISATAGIGSSLQPITSRLSPNGLVKAVGGAEGVFLDLQGGRLQEVIAKKTGVEQYGDVVIHTLDDLLPEAGGAGAIVGANITLSSLLGSVGTTADPIRMSAMGAFAQGGEVNVTALNDVHLVDNAAHNFLIGQIESTNGNISINVPNGSILNASDQTSAQALSQNQVEQVWKDLKLIRGSGADNAEARGSATAHSVTAFEDSMTSQYDRYWSLVGDGTVVNGVFALSTDPAVTAKYQARAAASGLTVQQYASQQYSTLTQSFEDNIGADWRTQQAFQAPQSTYRFTASQAQIDALTRESGWTQEELNYSVSEVALQSGSAPVGTGKSNLIGRNVTLNAGGSIGRLADPVDITLDDIAAGTLTPAQKAALALAKAPGDIVRLGTDAQGNFVTYQLANDANGNTDYGSIPAGVTAYGFRIAQTSPLFVEMSGALTADAGDSAFLQSVRPVLTVDHVGAGGTVGLIAPGSIVAAAQRTMPGTPVISAGADLRLTAGSGSLGTANDALTLSVGGKLVSASAGTDAYLSSDGTLTFDRIFAAGQVVLTAENGSLLAGAEGVAITAKGASLAASGDIGTPQSAVIVQIADNDTLTATAGGSATLQGAGASFHVASLTTGGDADLSAAGNLRADTVDSGGAAKLEAGGNLQAGTVTSVGAATFESVGDTTVTTLDSGGNVDFEVGGALVAGAITSAGAAGLRSTGDTTVATLESGGNVDFEVDGSIRIGEILAAGTATLGAHGSILSTAGFTGVNITANGITLTSGVSDIGAATKYLVIEDSGTTHAEAFGSIYLEQRGRSFVADELAAQTGSVGVKVTTGDATIGKITALDTVNVLLTTGGKLFIEDLDPATATLGVTGAGGSIEVERAVVGRKLSASASSIQLDDVSQIPGGSGPLHLVMQGAGGGMAQSVQANVTDANAVTVDRLAAQRAAIDANVANLWIESATIGSVGDFSNESYTASLDNVNRVRYDSDLQLYAPFPFYLRFYGEPKFETNALAIDYGDGFTVNGYGSGNSVTRFIPRLLSWLGLDRDERKAEAIDGEAPESQLVTWTSAVLIPDDAIIGEEQIEVKSK